MTTEKKIIEEAEWTVELNIKCPKCEYYFDYLKTDEYRQLGFEQIKIPESNSDADIDVECPNCNIDLFIKSLIY